MFASRKTVLVSSLMIALVALPGPAQPQDAAAYVCTVGLYDPSIGGHFPSECLETDGACEVFAHGISKSIAGRLDELLESDEGSNALYAAHSLCMGFSSHCEHWWGQGVLWGMEATLAGGSGSVWATCGGVKFLECPNLSRSNPCDVTKRASSGSKIDCNGWLASPQSGARGLQRACEDPWDGDDFGAFLKWLRAGK